MKILQSSLQILYEMQCLCWLDNEMNVNIFIQGQTREYREHIKNKKTCPTAFKSEFGYYHIATYSVTHK